MNPLKVALQLFSPADLISQVTQDGGEKECSDIGEATCGKGGGVMQHPDHPNSHLSKRHLLERGLGLSVGGQCRGR